MMVQNRMSASCFEIGSAPTADEEITFMDGVDDDLPSDMSSVISASQRSSVVTADSGRASSQSTLKSPEKDDFKLKKRSSWYRKMVVCRVALLDGKTFEPKGIDKNSDGVDVFEKITKHLDIIETDYFGLTYRDKSGKKFWLDHTKKISKQVKGGTWVFEFQVKFYPPDPMSLKEDITRYQLCLQLRVDIFNGKLPCSFVTYALLGSYTVQAELGDWDPIEFGHGIEYLHDFDFAPTQQPELLEKIAELHKHHKGQSPTVAEAHFLENTKKLAMYGVDMHDAKDSDSKDISLGICANGILVYKDRLRINRFVWPKILKLSYKRNNFYIKVRPGEFEPHERTMGFRCENHKLAKRLWKTCVEHHAFFRLKDGDGPNSDTLFPRFNSRFRYSGRTAHQARKAAEHAAREEPHIARTAERRSLVHHPDKMKNAGEGGNQQRLPYDENDKRANMEGDPNATAEIGRDGDASTLGRDGMYQSAPVGQDSADKVDHKPGDEPTMEGPPGYNADAAVVAEGGKKGKKEKEDEKKRKKEEERKRKEEEKEKKRLEKEKKKHQGKGQETAIDEMEPDAEVLEQGNSQTGAVMETSLETSPQKSKDKEKDRRSGGFFGKFGKRSSKDKSDKDRDSKSKDDLKEAEEAKIEQKPKAVMTWALPGMKEMMEKKASANQETQEEESENVTQPQPVPRIEIQEAPVSDSENKDPYEVEIQSESVAEVNQSIPVAADNSEVAVVATDEGNFEETAELEHKEFEKLESEIAAETEVSVAVVSKGEDSEETYKEELEAAIFTDDQLKEDFTQLLRETPDVTSQSRLSDVEHKISHDPRYQAVDSDARRQEWFNEYVNNMLKADYMHLLRETPAIQSQSTWNEARQEIDLDPRFTAVDSEQLRQEWFNEYVQNLLKSEFMQLLKDTPSIHSQSRWEGVKDYIELDPRYQAVGNDAQREAWFDEYVQNLKKAEFMELLSETPDITSYSRFSDVREDISTDPRFANIDTEDQREQYFNEYVQNLKKAGFVQLLRDTPDITAYSHWHEAKCKIDTDPRYHAVDSDLLRAKWFNEYVNNLAGLGYNEFGMKIGNYKSIDRKLEFLPLTLPSVTVRKSTDEPMPFFEPVGETDVDTLGKKRVPPPIAKKPRVQSGYESEEDRLMNSGVPVTVTTESYKYNPDSDDMPRSTSNIPIVETKTHKVTYEKDGIPYETEDSILISAHSVTTKSQTIDTTTYKTEKDGVVETRVERKITVTTDGDDDIDHDSLLRAAIEEVTNMNPDMSVEKIECMRQIEENR